MMMEQLKDLDNGTIMLMSPKIEMDMEQI